MSTVEPTGGASPRSAQTVRIVHLPAAAFRALADGDLAAANAASPVPLSAYFAGPDWRGTWRMRSEQVDRDPASAAWVTGVIWDERAQVAVGRAGYHGPPDDSGMVEIGYAVDPAYRRRGYARAALEALLHRAAQEPQVTTVRVTISPDNAASYALAAQYGFARVGEQWDEEDGLEIIYEVPAALMDAPDKTEVARWVAPAFIFCSVVLIPWIVYLGFSLPTRQISRHYDAAWVGFDIFELMALAATGYLALRRSRYLALAAASTATLLVTDAWFDVLTSPRHKLLEAIALAVVIELPLAGVCAWLSYHTEHLADRRISVVSRRMDKSRTKQNSGA